jgi:pyrroline-5-carboxylate reductase
MPASVADLSEKTIGFLGCGKISSCMVRGYATAKGTQRPAKILVSKRSEAKSAALARDFPGYVEVCEDNADLVTRSDVVFLGLLPPTARELLPTMPFGGETSSKLIISMLAAMDIGELRALCSGVPESQIVRTVPLPSVARQQGPILVHPVLENCISILEIVGTPVSCEQESEMKPLVCLTGHISSFYELMKTSEEFMTNNGVNPVAARTFVSAFYSSMAANTEVSTNVSLADMAIEAATPGGINEQGIDYLKIETKHFQNQTKSLEEVYDRLMGKTAYVKRQPK